MEVKILMNPLKQYLAPSKENTTLQVSAYQSKTVTPNACFITWTSADSCIWWSTGCRCRKMELPALMPHALQNHATRVGGFLFYLLLGNSIVSYPKSWRNAATWNSFFQPGVIIIWYVLRSHTLFCLNLLNITAATYWATEVYNMC